MRGWVVIVALLLILCMYAYSHRLLDWRPAYRGATTNLAVVTFSDDAIQAYAELSATVNELYCRRHGYTWRAFHESFDPELHPSWQRVWCLEKVLHDNPHCECVMWIDADAVFNNHTFRMEQVIGASTADKNLWIAYDPPRARLGFGLCAGVFILRRCAWSWSLLQRWREWAKAPQNAFYRWNHPWDQQGLHALIKMDPAPVERLPYWVFNGQRIARHPILHEMGRSTAYRQRVFRKVLQKTT